MKPVLPVYLLQSLQGHLFFVQSSIFSLKISSDFAFFILKGTISHILGAREGMLSVPKSNVQFICLCRVYSFLRFYGFCTKRKISFMIQALNHFSPYKFLVLRFVDFFGEYLLIGPFSANQKKDLFHLYGQVLKPFCEFY